MKSIYKTTLIEQLKNKTCVNLSCMYCIFNVASTSIKYKKRCSDIRTPIIHRPIKEIYKAMYEEAVRVFIKEFGEEALFKELI